MRLSRFLPNGKEENDAASVWEKDLEALIRIGDKVKVIVRSRGWPGSSHAERDPDEGEHDSAEHDSRGLR